MGYIILFLLIINTTMAFSAISKRKFEENIIFTIVSYITVLFLTGVIGNLNIGFYVIILANIIMLVYNIYAIAKRKINVKEQIFSFGFIVFILSYMLILWISVGRMSIEWDEFSHWSLAVKNMFNLGNLGLGEDSNLLCKNYLSGTSIFQFFCTRLCGEFKEGMLYVGMNVMLVSTILPIFKNVKTRKNLLSYICFGLMFCVPMYFYTQIYKTVYVDGILALAFANTLYSYFSNRDSELTKFKLIELIANIAFLTFIKDFGLVFAAGSLFIILVDNLFIKNKFHIKDVWKNSKYILLAAIPIVLIKGIWSVTLSVNEVISVSNTSNILPTMLNFVKGELLPYQTETVKNYLTALFETPLTVTYSLTFVMCVCIAIILAYVAVSHTNEERKKSIAVMLTLAVIGAGAYAILLMFVPFLALFSEYEAVRLASYSRYMNSYVLGLIFMELAIIIAQTSENKQKFNKFVLIFFAIFTMTFPFSLIKQMTVTARTSISDTQVQRSAYLEFRQQILENVKSDEKVYFIATNTNGAEYYISKYEATPVKVNSYGWSISNEPYNEEDIWTQVLTAEQWKQQLVYEYDYVYLYIIDEKFIENYGSLFYNIEAMENNQLYKINKEENAEAILELVAE